MQSTSIDEDSALLNRLWHRKQPQFTCLPDVAAQRVGGQVLYATEDQFCSKEDIIKQAEPVWHREEICDNQQRMDGWQTRIQSRSTVSDFCHCCIIKLGQISLLYGVDVDTAFFTGNYAPYISIQGQCYNSEKALPDVVFTSHKAVSVVTQKWEAVLEKTRLKSGYLATRHNYLHLKPSKLYNYLKINIYPGGGIARLRMYGTMYPEFSKSLPSGNNLLDLVSIENGGHCVNFSERCPERVKQIIEPYAHDKNITTEPEIHGPRLMKIGTDMTEDQPDQDWCIFKLGQTGVIQTVELVTNGSRRALNEFCRIDGCYIKRVNPSDPFSLPYDQLVWIPLLSRTELQACKQHSFTDLACQTVLSHVKLYLSPESNIRQVKLNGYRHNSLSPKL